MISKFNPISVDGWSCVPTLLFTWGQTMVEVMKVMETSFKRSRACTVTFSAPNPEASRHHPTTSPETPGHSQASQGQSLVESLLLSPGSWCTQGLVCALREGSDLIDRVPETMDRVTNPTGLL